MRGLLASTMQYSACQMVPILHSSCHKVAKHTNRASKQVQGRLFTGTHYHFSVFHFSLQQKCFSIVQISWRSTEDNEYHSRR